MLKSNDIFPDRKFDRKKSLRSLDKWYFFGIIN